MFLQTTHHSEEKWDHMMINNILLLLIVPSYLGTLALLKIFCIYFYASFSHVSLYSANVWPVLLQGLCSLGSPAYPFHGCPALMMELMLISQGCCFQSSVNRASSAALRLRAGSPGNLIAVVVLCGCQWGRPHLLVASCPALAALGAKNPPHAGPCPPGVLVFKVMGIYEDEKLV